MARPKRNPNFSTAEISILTEEVEKRKNVIFSRQNSSVTNQAKKGEWDLICEKVNAVNTSHLRTADELKKKWSVLCSETKKKISKLKREQVRTGGGQLPADCSVTPMEDKIQSIIGETALSGVDGGIDTLEEESKESNGMTGKGTLITPATDQSLDGSTDSIDSSTSSNRQTSTVSAKKRKIDIKSHSLDLIDIEKERLDIEKKRLDVEIKRLNVEEQRLTIERTRLQLEQEKHSIKLCQLGIISNATISSQQ